MIEGLLDAMGLPHGLEWILCLFYSSRLRQYRLRGCHCDRLHDIRRRPVFKVESVSRATK